MAELLLTMTKFSLLKKNEILYLNSFSFFYMFSLKPVVRYWGGETQRCSDLIKIALEL